MLSFYFIAVFYHIEKYLFILFISKNSKNMTTIFRDKRLFTLIYFLCGIYRSSGEGGNITSMYKKSVLSLVSVHIISIFFKSRNSFFSEKNTRKQFDVFMRNLSSEFLFCKVRGFSVEKNSLNLCLDIFFCRKETQNLSSDFFFLQRFGVFSIGKNPEPQYKVYFT